MTLNNLISDILSLPVSWRAVIFFGVLFFLWLLFAKSLLKIVSIVPFLIKKIILGLYYIFEFPISALHKYFGGLFGVLDRGLASISKKIYDFIDKLYNKMRFPKTLLKKQLFVVYLFLCAYLLIPMWAHLTEKPFTFWQQKYIENEECIIEWMKDNGWFEP